MRKPLWIGAALSLALACSNVPDTNRVGVFAETDAGVVELRTFGQQAIQDSFRSGLGYTFRFGDLAAIDAAQAVSAFFINIPDARNAETRAFHLPDLGARWSASGNNPADPQPLAATLESVKGNMYKLSLTGDTQRNGGYIAIKVTMPPGTADRLYAVRVQGKASAAAPQSSTGDTLSSASAGQLNQEVRGPFGGNIANLTAGRSLVAFSLIGADPGIVVLNTANMDVRRMTSHGEMNVRLAISGDDRRIAVHYPTDVVEVWDIQSNTQVGTQRLPGAEALRFQDDGSLVASPPPPRGALALAGDGFKLTVGEYAGGANGHSSIEFREPQTDKIIATYQTPAGFLPTGIAMTTDRTAVALGSNSGQVMILRNRR